MKKLCKTGKVLFKKSDNKEEQGKREKIVKYLKQGYKIKEERNGYWLLTKKAECLVSISFDDETEVINLRRQILDFYSKDRLTQNLCDKFEKELKNGSIGVYLKDDEYVIE
jgi:hypothetical protein